MDEITKLFGYVAVISVCGVIILRIILELRRRKSSPAPHSGSVAHVAIDSPVEFPPDILKSYRMAIDNSRTTMAYLTYLASHHDATEDEITSEVTRIITKAKPAEPKHVRHVLFAVLGSHFVGFRNSAWIYLTPLGKKAFYSITHRDEDPPATANEIGGYRTLISQNVAQKTILALLRQRHSLSKTALTEQVIEVCKKDSNQSTPPLDRIDAIIRSAVAFGWLSDNGETCTITELGKLVCDDLHL